MSFLTDMIKETGNEYAGLVADGVEAGDVESFIDSGSYALNALLSGSIYGGLPGNKITAFAGESATGKTFFVLGIVKQFLSDNPDGGVLYFESESAITKDMIEKRGIDSSRMVMLPVASIQEFAHQSTKILDKYLADQERKPMMICLDSLGMLSTSKEMEDIANDKQVRDMTKSQLIKGAFRVLTLKLGQAQVPMLVTNHTYDVIGSYMPTKEMGGGTGLKYAASTIIYLTKSKERDSKKEVVGNIIKCEAKKSRLTVEGSKIATRLFFDERGLDKYYGLLELGEQYGVFQRVGNRIRIGESSVYPSAILASPDKYFTEEVMEKLEEAAKKEFSYGG